MTKFCKSLLLFAALTADLLTANASKLDIATTPVDPLADSQTQALYRLLYDNYGQQVMTCSMAQPVWDYEIAKQVQTLTGQRPAMHCFDLMHLCYSPSNWINYNDVTPVTEWHQQGGIVSLMWHWQVPTAPSATAYTSSAGETDFTPANVLKEGTWEHQLFYEDLWEAYTVIQQLQDAGIPVIWRPLHEAAGNVPKGGQAWFWWGKDGADVFRQLWHRMYDYFQERGIHNLIWVWTSCDSDDEWFPGDSYVDIVGTDIYDKDINVVKTRFQELQFRYPTHMLALSECGKVPYLTIQRQEGAIWLWVMPWYNSTDVTWVTDAWWKDAIRNYTAAVDNPRRTSHAGVSAMYTLDGRITTARNGLRIVRMNDGSVQKVSMSSGE